MNVTNWFWQSKTGIHFIQWGIQSKKLNWHWEQVFDAVMVSNLDCVWGEQNIVIHRNSPLRFFGCFFVTLIYQILISLQGNLMIWNTYEFHSTIPCVFLLSCLKCLEMYDVNKRPTSFPYFLSTLAICLCHWLFKIGIMLSQQK